MEQIKNYIKANDTIIVMLLNRDNDYFKRGALEQIRLDVGVSLDYLYANFFEIFSFCSVTFSENKKL